MLFFFCRGTSFLIGLVESQDFHLVPGGFWSSGTLLIVVVGHVEGNCVGRSLFLCVFDFLVANRGAGWNSVALIHFLCLKEDRRHRKQYFSTSSSLLSTLQDSQLLPLPPSLAWTSVHMQHTHTHTHTHTHATLLISSVPSVILFSGLGLLTRAPWSFAVCPMIRLLKIM